MLKTSFAFLFGLLVLNLKAQENKVLCNDDDTAFCSRGVEGMGFSRGISLDYDMLPNFRLNTYSPDQSAASGSGVIEHNRRITLKIKAPIVNKPTFKALIALKYRHEKYAFADASIDDNELFRNLEQNSLKTTSLGFYMLKSLNSRYYLAFGLQTDFRGDYEKAVSFDRDYLAYTASAIMGMKKSKNLELGWGLLYNYTFGFHSVYPVLIYNHTFNEQWGLETVLPKQAKLRYNAGENTILYGGMEAHASNYLIEGGPNLAFPDDLRMRQQELRFGFSLEQCIWSPLCISLDAGYRKQLNFNVAYEYAGRRDFFIRSESLGSFYATASVFITVPKRFRK